MNAKEYLSQAFLIDKRINSKIEQLDNLRAISRMTNRQISDMPGSPNRNTHKLEDTVIKIVELEAEIDSDIDALVDLKADITHRIKQINGPEYQLVLELRYLCFKSWEEIAMQMGYDGVPPAWRGAESHFRLGIRAKKYGNNAGAVSAKKHQAFCSSKSIITVYG